MRSASRPLNGEERLEAIHGLLRPGKPFMFSWDAVGARSGLTSKDLVCPATLDFKPEGSGSCFKSEDAWCQVLSINRFGSELSDRCLADIIDLPIPLSISIHVQALDKSKAVAFVKKRIAWMDKEIIDEQMSAVKKGYDFQILPSELKYSKEEAEDLLDHLQNRNQRLYVYTGLVYTYAPTREELNDQMMQIVSTARRNSIEADALDYRQREGLNSVLPLGHNHVEVSRMMTTAQVAIQMPFATQELAQDGGGYYGQNKQSSNLVLCNRKKLASPMGFVAGKPGSGKSFSVKREIENTILAYPEDEIIILDPAGEYSPVVVANGGESIRFAPDSDTHLNPFDLADVAHQPPSAQMAFKIDAFLALSSATMAEGAEGLPEADKSIISRCVEAAYREAAETGGAPLLGDFHRILLSQPEPEARDIALRYERYVEGALSFFNHPSNVGFERRITNIDFNDLSENMSCLRHHRGTGVRSQPHVLQLREGRHHLALHRRGAIALRAPRHHQLLLQVLGRGTQVQPHRHRHNPEQRLHAGARGGAQHGAQLRLRAAAQAVPARPPRLGGPARHERAGGLLHRRVGAGGRGPAHRRRRARAPEG